MQDAKTVYFNFAVNRHGMSDTAVFERLKKLKTGVEVAKEFVSLLNHLLDNDEKLMHVNIEEAAVVKANVSTQGQRMLVMETPTVKTPLARRSGAIRASKKPPVAVMSQSVKTDIVIKTEKVDGNEDVKAIDVTNNREDDVDPMNMNVYKNVASKTAKYASPKNAKKYIQSFVSNLFHHKTDENKNVYAVMTNFRECIWYMKSDFIVSCLAGMEKTPLFMIEYRDVDMYWINEFTDFSIRIVKHDIGKYKKSKTSRTLEMMLLPVALFKDDDGVTIEDQVCFIFEDVLKRVFCKYKVGGISRGKMLLDFLETKSHENVFAEECVTEELNSAFHTTPIQYSWNVSLDKFMMNSDIKLFWWESVIRHSTI